MSAGGDAAEPELEPGVMKFLGLSPEELNDVLNEMIDSSAKLEEEYQGQSP
jgi:hypothetical protein